MIKWIKKRIDDFVWWGGWKKILCMCLTVLSVSYVMCSLVYLLE